MARQGAAPARLDRGAESSSRTWPPARSSASATTPASSRCCCRSAPSTRSGNRLYHPLWEAIARQQPGGRRPLRRRAGQPAHPVRLAVVLLRGVRRHGQRLRHPAHQHRLRGRLRPVPEPARSPCSESGFTWLPAHMWRFDKEWKNLRRLVPWVKRAPVGVHPRARPRRRSSRSTRRPTRRSCCRSSSSSARTTCCCTPADYPHRHAADPERDAAAPTCRSRSPGRSAARTPARCTGSDDRDALGLQLRRHAPRQERDDGRDGRQPSRRRRPSRATTRPALIDCDFHNELDSIKDLYPYLSKRWPTTSRRYGLRGRPAATTRASWTTARTPARPRAGARGSEVALLAPATSSTRTTSPTPC